MTYRDVVLSIEGLRNKDLAEEHIYRRMTAIIASTGFNGKIMRQFNKLWPIKQIGKQESVSDRGKAVLKQLREYEALNKATGKLNGGRSGNTSRRRRSTGK
jgi:hypothetical protein